MHTAAILLLCIAAVAVTQTQKQAVDLNGLTWTGSSWCAPPLIPHSNVSQSQSSGNGEFPTGTVLTVTCDRGRLLEPRTDKIECRNGSWTAHGTKETTMPQCKVWCQRPLVENGDVTNSATEYPPRTTLAVLCNDGYRLSNKFVNTLVCHADDGSWVGHNGAFTREVPECVLATCPPLPIAPNSIVQYRGTTGWDGGFHQGSKVSYACRQGFRLLFEDGRTVGRDFECRNGTWQDLVSISCELIGCGPPPTIANGDAVMDSSLKFLWPAQKPPPPVPYPVGSKVTYSCHDGFVLVGFSKRYRCSAKGRWVPTHLPTCKGLEKADPKSVSCPPPPVIPFARLRNATAGQFRPNSAVFYVCDEGFHLDGLPNLICDTEGQWQPRPGPACRPRIILPDDCLKPPPPSKTSFDGALNLAGAKRQMVSVVVASLVSAVLLTVLLAVQLSRRGGWKYLSSWANARMPLGGAGSSGGGSDCEASRLGFPSGVQRDNSSSLICCEPDRVALLNGSGVHQVLPPTYEEAIRQGGPPPSDIFYGCILPNHHRNRYHFLSLRNARDSAHDHTAPPAASGAPTRHSSSSTSHSACGHSSSMADSLNSTDTVTPSEVSTTVTVDTLSSTTSHPTSTTSTRAFCGSLASFDTAESDSALNMEGVPLLEEAECDQSVSPNLENRVTTLEAT